ncbi:MAG: tRNA (adenosine(37)-N6)-threonylcarbamoyltransferase complex dimerization subunit type 1 TsaB [Bacteroidia bacterium]
MALILNLETATTVCSVSLGKDGKLLALKELQGDYTHAENLTSFIEEVLSQAKLSLSQLDAIAISKGPGSYTGLRIGVSTAKGLCYALNKPLIAVDTLQHLSLNLPVSIIGNAVDVVLCPMIDARRMEVYCALYNINNDCLKSTWAEIIDNHSFADLFSDSSKIVYFFGDGAAKCKEILSLKNNALFIDNVFPSAKNMIPLSEKAFLTNQFEDVAYFEPFYLKDFVAGKKKIQ